VDFKNTVVIMTSNLGSDIIQDKAGEERYDEMKAAVMDVLGMHFRPEFINRVDDIVVFHPLGMAHIQSIAKIQLLGLRQRLLDKGYKLEVSGRALEQLAKVGFDPVYGARPLKRAIQHELENPLATALLSQTEAGGNTIKIDASDDGLEIVFKS
jgi:ATP-dependent Clp protease ATP-binding subunit ClpB